VDDHIVFLKRGVPAVDVIDFEIPYWHTVEDTLDKVSAKSLAIPGTFSWKASNNFNPNRVESAKHTAKNGRATQASKRISLPFCVTECLAKSSSSR